MLCRVHGIRTQRNIPPLPPSKGGKSESEGGMLSLQRGECGAVSHQQTACGMPCRGEPQCSPFFCVVSAISEREFRKWAQINANNCVCHSASPLCHSERSEESRLERPRRSSLRPRAVSRRSSEQDERKSGCPKRSKLPDFPTCKRREGV